MVFIPTVGKNDHTDISPDVGVSHQLPDEDAGKTSEPVYQRVGGFVGSLGTNAARILIWQVCRLGPPPSGIKSGGRNWSGA